MKLGSKMYPDVAYERGEDVYLFSADAGLPFSPGHRQRTDGKG